MNQISQEAKQRSKKKKERKKTLLGFKAAENCLKIEKVKQTDPITS